jgi:hypothetical protein
MSSEILGGAENLLKGNLGGAWDIKHGYADAYTDLGIARRFGGSAAAYSLRDIGAMNGRVVKVRRDQDDPDGSTNDPEEDFSASQISTGSLEDWINGKLETALPCNMGGTDFASGSFVVSNSNSLFVNGTYVFNSSNSRWEKTSTIYFHLDGSTWKLVVGGSSISATTSGEYPWTSIYSLVPSNVSFDLRFSSIVFSTAAAAYSLRKVNNGYTGSAVRIRRGSDDIEVNVAFDSEDKVSASSSILNTTEQGGESGQTTTTDLNGFLNEKLTVGTAVNGTGSFNNYTVTNATTTGFSADNSSGGTGSAGFPYIFAEDDIIVVKYTVSNFSSTSSLSPQIRGTTGTNSVTSVASGGTTFTANGTYTDTLTASADGTHLMFADGNTGSYTISDFEIVSHAHQAFVNTWYDQGSSNNAVQETATKQPKIAESGALLADGLTFDGSNDFLQTTSQVLTGTETGANSMYAVVKQTSGDAGYICGSAASPDGASNQIGQSLYGASNDKIVLTNGNDATATGTLDTITRIEGSNYLVSSNYSNNNTDTLHSNANAYGYADGSSAYDFLAGDRFTIGARKDSTSAAAVLFTGSMKEIIAYNSDQTDNRFRIESNINNYYNLYNDANEFASNETAFRFLNERSGGISASSNLTQFTLDVQTASGYAGAKFNKDVTLGDSIYISFNASLDEGAATASPKVGLRNIDSALNGTLYSNEGLVTEGFNSFKLTSTNSTASGIVWSEGDDNVIFTITDIKVSRIARNGFVETWYDQSGNGLDMSQTTAADQPHIVENGGICKDPSGNNPTIKFVNVGTNLGSTFLSNSNFPTANQVMSAYFVASTETTTPNRQTLSGGTSDIALDTDEQILFRRGGNNRAFSNLDVSINTNNLVVVSNDSSYVPTGRLNGTSQSQVAFSGGAGEKTFEFLGENSGNASGDVFGLQGTISEAILYNDIEYDSEIESDIATYYNITLS